MKPKTHTKTLLIALVTCTAVVVGSAQADTIPVAGFGFEAPSGVTVGAPTGWTGSGFNGGTHTDSVTEGSQSLWIDGSGHYVFQDTGHVIQTGEEFTLTVDLRSGTGGEWNIELYGSTAGETSPLASKTIVGDTTWLTDQTLSYTASGADDGQTLGIRLHYVTKVNQGKADNVRLDVVPEPSSLALLGLGGLLIARRRRG